VIRDEKALQIIHDLAANDMLHNITLYFAASIVVNSKFGIKERRRVVMKYKIEK